MFPHKGAWSSKGLIIQINFCSALTLVDSAIADSSESDCELQTRAEARFSDQKLSYCYTSGLLLHKFSSRFCVNRSWLMRVFLQKFIFKQYAAPSTESFFWPSFHFHSFTKSFHQHIKNPDLEYGGRELPLSLRHVFSFFSKIYSDNSNSGSSNSTQMPFH